MKPRHCPRQVLRPALATSGALLLLLVLEPGAAAQLPRAALTTNPPARAEHASAREAVTGDVLVFGGLDTSAGGITFGDTWTFNGFRWLQELPVTSPPARARSAMATDTARGVSVLFSGSNGFADTWEWGGANWTLSTPFASPPARTMHAMAFDPTAGLVVLFGGRGSLSLNDTWTFDGVTWTQIAMAGPMPAVRENHTLEFFPTLGLVLFGGQNGAALFSDTWVLSTAAGTWTQLFPATSPPARGNHAMYFDEGLGLMVMAGGSSGIANFADQWSFDGTTWALSLATAPPAFEGHSMDAGPSGRAVTFGGRSMGQFSRETFLRASGIRPLGEAVPTTHDVTATGCALPPVTPQLSSDTLPVIGGNYTLDMQGFPANQVVTLSIGLFPAIQSCVAPFSMGHIPGIVNTLFAPGGSVSFSQPVPNDVGLAGLQVFSQAFGFDSAGGFLLTNQTTANLGF